MDNINDISKSSKTTPIQPAQQLRTTGTKVAPPTPSVRNDNLNISGTAANSQRQRPVQSFRFVERSPEPLRTETQPERLNLTERIASNQQENFRENFRGARADTSEGTLAQSPQTREAIQNQTTPAAQQRRTLEDPNNLNLNEQIAANQQEGFQNENRGAALPVNDGRVIQSPQTAARLAEAQGRTQTEPTPPGAPENTGGLESLATGATQRDRAADNRTTATPPRGETNFVESTPQEVGAPANRTDRETLPPQNQQQIDLISGELGEN